MTSSRISPKLLLSLLGLTAAIGLIAVVFAPADDLPARGLTSLYSAADAGTVASVEIVGAEARVTERSGARWRVVLPEGTGPQLADDLRRRGVDARSRDETGLEKAAAQAATVIRVGAVLLFPAVPLVAIGVLGLLAIRRLRRRGSQ